MQNILNIGNLLISNQDIWIVHIGNHFFFIITHVARQIAMVKLHTFYHADLGIHGLGFFDGNHAVFTDFFHGICDHLTHFFASGRNGGNLGNVFLTGNRFAHDGQSVYCRICSFFHAFTKNDRICSCGNIFHAFINDSLCQ